MTLQSSTLIKNKAVKITIVPLLIKLSNITVYDEPKKHEEKFTRPITKMIIFSFHSEWNFFRGWMDSKIGKWDMKKWNISVIAIISNPNVF